MRESACRAPAKWIIKRPRAGISLCANSKAAFKALVGGKIFLSDASAKKNKSYFLAAYCRKVVLAPTAFTVVAPPPLWSLKVLWNSKSHSAFRVFWRARARARAALQNNSISALCPRLPRWFCYCYFYSSNYTSHKLNELSIDGNSPFA